jgi:hypothetical protein
MKTIFKTLAFLFLTSSFVFAQVGDGPESHFLKPKGMWGLNFKYINLSQNLSLNGDYINPALDLEINAFPITAFHTFAIKGQHAEVVAMINPTSISSNSSFPLLGISNEDCKSGFSDGFVGFKFAMVNGKAVTFEEYVKQKPEFLMMSYFRVWFSGSYDKNELVNLGTNRTTFEYGIPTTMPLFSKNNSSTHLELFPSIRFFTKNKEVLDLSSGNHVEKTQKPLFVFENHIIHNFNKKFRATLNGRYQLGGETTTNDVKGDNSFNNYSGTVGVGYQFHPLVYLHVDYGGILFGSDDAESNMFRVNLQLNYLKLNKKK